MLLCIQTVGVRVGVRDITGHLGPGTLGPCSSFMVGTSGQSMTALDSPTRWQLSVSSCLGQTVNFKGCVIIVFTCAW